MSELSQTESRLPHLTPTEQRLLDVLRAAPGRVFSRKELLAVIMPHTIVLERTIDAHIRSLRKKLGESAKAIRTVRLGGYCYVPETAASPPP
jgi:two-component system phosphate regulon response regulator PhoB